MGKQTKIQWCDSTINFWSGCTMVPAADGLKDSGCLHCYAKAYDDRHLVEKKSHWGKGAPRLKQANAFDQALAMNRRPWICHLCGAGVTLEDCPGLGEINDLASRCPNCERPANMHRRRIFSLSRGDWLDDEVPIEWLAEMLNAIRQCDQVMWILCTKRPELFWSRLAAVRKLWACDGGFNETDEAKTYHWICHWMELANCAPKNIVLLASVENQPMAHLRIPELLKIPAVCHGLSVEPLLGPVDIKAVLDQSGIYEASNIDQVKLLNWLIIGGESGPGARRCDLGWIRSLVAQGAAAGVPTFVKQLGGNLSDEDLADCSRFSGRSMHDKKGGDPSEWPADLRIRQFPQL